ncbi:triphosphoribosyl-dephospho-CoA synthase CitG [Vibrio algarum]|uniref:Probable 2-(5''-triphosphoribosyl)-3'-dephosphocoenzyme-A synthase n=1 Tax=Vibrio algarum TaxID=3020714 RepID=A0ABT4YTR9_9VIBR|nr:triphosphoribosyl-dephospho-CoA synthase CitG [Vibrio sp. KJ40-1]MDB1124959.1 triphosphoribosyl-dephospho-CoA synthase CitG [Vibrio sp. KJ40-1]
MIASNSIRWLLNDCCLYDQTASGMLELNVCELAGNLAYHAMMLEAHLTPKPGLVDCISSGAHSDMDIDTFILSSDALRPFMKQFVRVGFEKYQLSEDELLPHLRRIGIEAERAMFDVTNGVNTHKGMIFTLGLICGSVGWLHRKGLSYDALHIRSVITKCCGSLVSDDLKASTKIPVTAGERLFKEHGLTGIRGEAAQGYPTIFLYGLPVYENSVLNGESEEQAMSKTLFSLMANNSDTNLVNRGGMQGLAYVQKQSRQLLNSSERTDIEWENAISKFDRQLVERNLSPGGSADLLAATWLLAQLNICSNSNQQYLG